jgi:hypothetical protein
MVRSNDDRTALLYRVVRNTCVNLTVRLKSNISNREARRHVDTFHFKRKLGAFPHLRNEPIPHGHLPAAFSPTKAAA